MDPACAYSIQESFATAPDVLLEHAMLELESLTERIIGCAIEVHRAVGPGLLESCYERALAIEFAEQGVDFVKQPAVPVAYKGRPIGQFRPDFIVEHLVIVELKCVSRVDPVFQDQVLTYLRATRLKVGLFMNFHSVTLRAGLKRYVL
jgi:GxxExxY protein